MTDIVNRTVKCFAVLKEMPHVDFVRDIRLLNALPQPASGGSRAIHHQEVSLKGDGNDGRIEICYSSDKGSMLYVARYAIRDGNVLFFDASATFFTTDPKFSYIDAGYGDIAMFHKNCGARYFPG